MFLGWFAGSGSEWSSLRGRGLRRWVQWRNGGELARSFRRFLVLFVFLAILME
jgi:hypothetical protein